jgi:antitoxin MazE
MTSDNLRYTLYWLNINRGRGHASFKWGNSLAVRLPAAIVKALKLKEGDEIEMQIADDRRFGVTRKPGRGELLKRLRAFRGRLPADFKFDRDKAIAR